MGVRAAGRRFEASAGTTSKGRAGRYLGTYDTPYEAGVAFAHFTEAEAAKAHAARRDHARGAGDCKTGSAPGSHRRARHACASASSGAPPRPLHLDPDSCGIGMSSEGLQLQDD